MTAQQLQCPQSSTGHCPLGSWLVTSTCLGLDSSISSTCTSHCCLFQTTGSPRPPTFLSLFLSLYSSLSILFFPHLLSFLPPVSPLLHDFSLLPSLWLSLQFHLSHSSVSCIQTSQEWWSVWASHCQVWQWNLLKFWCHQQVDICLSPGASLWARQWLPWGGAPDPLLSSVQIGRSSGHPEHHIFSRTMWKDVHHIVIYDSKK